MLIRHKQPFTVGLIFFLSFLGVLLLIFSPVFDGKNGLQYSDESFNRLAKGSSYFIPKVKDTVDKYSGKQFSMSMKVDEREQVENTVKLFTTAGAVVEANGQELKISGDLGRVLQSVLADADAMYKNDGETISKRYAYDEKLSMKNWWYALSKIEKQMKKDKLLEEAKVVGTVMKKAVEPGYNFYKIDANKVSEHVGMLTGLLVFYVAYTMWWGYAIFYLFEGVGLSMKKAHTKKEA